MKSVRLLVLVLIMAVPCYGKFNTKPDIIISNKHAIRDLAFGDLNKDAKPDIIAAISSYKKCEELCFFYNINGKFKANPDRKMKFDRPWKIGIDDFTGDGVNDIVVSAKYNSLYILPGKDDYKKKYKHDVASKLALNTLAWGKLSSKNKMDFLTAEVWHKWSGGNNFKLGFFASPSGGNNINRQVSIFDLDEDGNNDVIYNNMKRDKIRIYFGPFLNWRITPKNIIKFVEFKVSSIDSFFIADVNNDGQADIVYSSDNKKEKKVSVFYQDRSGSLESNIKPVSIIDGVTGKITIGDINGDAINDIIVFSYPKIYLYYGTKNGVIKRNKFNVNSILKSIGGHGIKLYDLNKDGKQDLITWNHHKIAIYFNR